MSHLAGGSAGGTAGAVLAALIVTTVAGDAVAGRVVVADTHAEADLVDEAGGVTLLLRAALDRPGRAVAAGHELRGVVIDLDRAADVMSRLDGAALVACDLERDGTGLRVSVIAIDRDGSVSAAGSVVAGDGDLPGLVAAAVQVVAPVIGADAAVPEVSLGQLRPFVRAEAALRRGDVAAAALELRSAEQLLPLKVSSIGPALRPGWAGAAVDQPTALSIALAAGTPQDVLDLAHGGTGRDRAAVAIAHIAVADYPAAEAALSPAGDEPLALLARARLAFRRGQRSQLAAAMGKLVPKKPRGAPFIPALALVVELPPGALPADVEDRALALARADPRLSRLASALGLRVALRPGADLEAALAAIHVVDLDGPEVLRLTPIVERAVAAGSRPALRLATELAARGGTPADVDAAVKRWLGVAADDPDAQRFRGRLAVAAMRLDDARAAFTTARADRELARVAIAAGDWATAERLLATAPDDSAERALVTARLALQRDDLAAAQAALETARAVAPASPALLDLRAVTLERAGDAAAIAARALADKVAPPRAARVDLDRPGGPSTTPGGGSGATVVAGARSLDEPLVAALTAPLAALPLPARGTVYVIELPSPSPGLLSLRVAHPGPLRPPLTAALERRGLTVPRDDGAAARARARVSEPLVRERLEALADDLGVADLVLYRVAADGSDAQVRLVAFDRRTGLAHEVRTTVPGASHGLVAWNRGRFQLGAGVLAVLAILGVLWFVRGRSHISVEIVSDPDGSDEVLCIEISHSSARPDVGDPTRFRRDMRKAGHEVTRRSARLAEKRTSFQVPPGTWFVHVYGVYTRDHVDRVVPPLHSHKVEVARGRTGAVRVDLGLPVAEIKVTLHDEQRAGIAVWLDTELADKVYTDADGVATLYAAVGEHVLVIDARDLRIEKPLHLPTAQLEKVAINLPRERRLAEVSEGLTLGPTVHGPATAPARDDAIGTMIELGAATPAGEPSEPSPSEPFDVARDGPRESKAPGAAASPTAATVASVGAAAAAPLAAASVAAAPLRDAEPEAGSRVLGRYRVEAELGRGAMGVVFRAWDENLERAVAVKVLSRAVREFPQAMSMFVQEARALAQLNHPNIVTVHDQVSDGTDTYIIMELVDGTTVDRVLRERGPLPLRPALGVIDQLCSGLTYAHRKKVVHRDIKPANIFISRDKVVKLGDFGIARVLRELEIRQTEVRGTPLYMAPEQINGTNINHRADLYAVGCTLFELVAGHPPFLDGNVMAHHLFTEPPRLSSVVPSVPAALDDLIAACLVKDPTARVDSAAAIQEQLHAVAADLPR